MTPNGLVLWPSVHSVEETVSRLTTAVTDRGMEVLAIIDHSAAARSVGLELLPTIVLVFGNPAVGTLVMQTSETIALDLPLRTLVCQRANGETSVACTDPAWLAQRHGAEVSEAVTRMAEALAASVTQASG